MDGHVLVPHLDPRAAIAAGGEDDVLAEVWRTSSYLESKQWELDGAHEALRQAVQKASSAGVAGVDQSLLFQVVLPLVLSPLVAYSGSFLLVYPATWVARYTQPNVVNQRFRRGQAVAAGAVAFGHGLQDGQRVSAVLLLALLAAGYSDGGIPTWVAALSAVMMTAGTLFGGWRISHTIGYKITRIDPLRGSVAQTFSALMLFVGAIGLHWPLSTTHTVTAGALGAGENQHFSVTNRKLVIRILWLWGLTPLATCALGFVLALALSPISA
jgi:PiT family inorganic phosphate transporter